MPRYMIATLVALLIGGSRWLYETSLVISVGDAQGGIWIGYSLIVSGITVLVTFLLAYLALRFFAERMRILCALCLVGVLLVAGHTGRAMLRLRDIRVALSDAANPTSSPDRLRSLVGYQTGFGYEIDNRIALNPNTPIDVLRALHGTPDQVGTEMCLARNPNTPDDILIEIANREHDYAQEWIQKSLRMNPRYGQVFGPTTGSSVRLPRGGATATDP